jgi:NifU-like protein involved in Fe-S cluster formation
MVSAPVLYTPEILALATKLAANPLNETMPFLGHARSKSCGSVLTLSLAKDDSDRITALGLRAQACAIGQASAAIFADSAIGKSRAEIAAAASAIESWLKGQGLAPDWPGISAIEPAIAYPARHGAILLAWWAALDALPSA